MKNKVIQKLKILIYIFKFNLEMKIILTVNQKCLNIIFHLFFFLE